MLPHPAPSVFICPYNVSITLFLNAYLRTFSDISLCDKNKYFKARVHGQAILSSHVKHLHRAIFYFIVFWLLVLFWFFFFQVQTKRTECMGVFLVLWILMNWIPSLAFQAQRTGSKAILFLPYPIKHPKGKGMWKRSQTRMKKGRRNAHSEISLSQNCLLLADFLFFASLSFGLILVSCQLYKRQHRKESYLHRLTHSCREQN